MQRTIAHNPHMRPRIDRTAAFCLGAVLALSLACHRGGVRSTGSSTQTTESAPGTEATPSGTTSISEITYEVSGGIAGFQLLLQIDREGKAVVYDRGNAVRHGQLTTQEWQVLQRLVEAAELPSLAAEYGREGAVADGMREVVTVQSGERSVQVATVTDPTAQPPQAFTDLTSRLMELTHTLPAN